MANPEFQSLQPLYSLLNSAVAMPFAKAARELGCADLPQTPFVDELRPYLDTAAFDKPNTPDVRADVWRAVLHGRVLAVEPLTDGGMLFHVRARLSGGLCIDVRLRYRSDEWRVQSVTSIHYVPFTRTRTFARMVSGACVVVAGCIGFLLADSLHHGGKTSAAAAELTKQGVESWAQSHGYQLVKPGSQSASAPAAASSSASAGKAASEDKASTTSSSDKQTADAAKSTSPSSQHAASSAPKTYTYTLRLGTPVHDLSVFLQQHHLVKSAIAFDMKMKDTHADQDLRPGTYTFRSNMSESDLIRVLKAGPKS
ncbi:hypothetical protein [Alicyclobacillus shizuokensis]|uniref:hypothetical protein n=1 Tax=Alicyclobacillus shizuokensis TaxID=392014 RepID=UPI000835E18F|nr:hypothetical protein [Alicyclobacillus shizuokensis]MCL6627354.1 endolytic transglycosylase MltG [Alicyclobacillus shizuokensis]